MQKDHLQATDTFSQASQEAAAVELDAAPYPMNHVGPLNYEMAL